MLQRGEAVLPDVKAIAPARPIGPVHDEATMRKTLRERIEVPPAASPLVAELASGTPQHRENSTAGDRRREGADESRGRRSKN